MKTLLIIAAVISGLIGAGALFYAVVAPGVGFGVGLAVGVGAALAMGTFTGLAGLPAGDEEGWDHAADSEDDYDDRGMF